jgi:hypothetical protein
MGDSFNMQERKEPTFVQFAEGEVIEGLLVSIDRIEVGEQKKPTPRFVVKDLESGQLQCFLGTYDIATKLKRADIGHVIRVRYEGEDRTVSRNGNSLKKFKVEVSDRPYAAAAAGRKDIEAGTLITDEDIPF